MQLTHINLGSKNTPASPKTYNKAPTKNNSSSISNKSSKVSFTKMVNALQAQTLTETPAVVLEKMITGTVSGKAKEWSYISKPEGGSILTCNLEGKQYSLESIKTDKTFKENGTKHYKMKFVLKTKMPDEKVKVFNLTKEQYSKASKKINHLVMPKIEKMYNLGKNLDVTNILISLARATLDKKIKWEQVDANINFKNGLSIKSTKAIKTELSSGIKIHILEKASNTPFSSDETSFISLEKPNLPPQVIHINSDKEKQAYELFKLMLLIESL